MELEQFVSEIIDQMTLSDKKQFCKEGWREGIQNYVAYTEHDTSEQVEWILDEIQRRLLTS